MSPSMRSIRWIDKTSGEEAELDDYTIKSVSHGKDMLGEVHVVLN
ncbi:hypothetical protein [Paenibacillus sp. y28]